MRFVERFLARASLALSVALFAAMALTGTGAAAEDYPTRTVRLVVPFPAGGPTDIIGRIVAQALTELLGQQVIVDNRGGANGTLGTEIVAKAKPDGYTLLLSASGPLASGLALYKNIPYDPVRDFTAISPVGKSNIVLVASGKFPAATFKDFIALAKAKPDSVTAELNTIGSMHHLLTALLSLRTGAKLLFVPYKGSGPAVIDLLGGHVNVGFESVPGVAGYIQNKQLRAYAVASAQRLDSMPDVPTLTELGFKEFVAEPWFAVMAPAGTPKPVVEKLSAALAKVAKMPTVAKQLAAQGAAPVWMSPDETAKFLATEVSRWASIVKETGVTMP